jgi:sRNA-binding regulator protein Hfq
MANSSHIPASGLHEVRSNPAIDTPATPLRAVTPSVSGNSEEMHPMNGHGLEPRKLVRPTLPARSMLDRGVRAESPISSHNTAMLSALASYENTHAEAFYFQKQVQTQTLMVFVLEDGDRVEGYIEWYDRDVIKVKNDCRTLIYKSSIKYLYKAGETHG